MENSGNGKFGKLKISGIFEIRESENSGIGNSGIGDSGILENLGSSRIANFQILLILLRVFKMLSLYFYLNFTFVFILPADSMFT